MPRPVRYSITSHFSFFNSFLFLLVIYNRFQHFVLIFLICKHKLVDLKTNSTISSLTLCLEKFTGMIIRFCFFWFSWGGEYYEKNMTSFIHSEYFEIPRRIFQHYHPGTFLSLIGQTLHRVV